jgi:mRNA interferase MazF
VEIKPSESGLDRGSVVKLNQIRTIDKKRLIRKLGEVSSSKMKAVNSSLMLSLGLQN